MERNSEAQRFVFLTGGTGFVGRQVVRCLLGRGHRVRALVRDPDSAGALRDQGVELAVGDITAEAGLAEAAAGCDAVVHLVGIIRERPPSVTFEAVHTRGTLRVVEAARRAGVKKIVHMSALGARPDGTAYQRTKYEAEELVRRSGLRFVILRPSIIVGEGGEFVDTLRNLVCRLPVTPVIGDGSYRLQPVDVRDVAIAFAQALERTDLEGRRYEIGGPHKLTYNRIVEIFGEEFGTRRRKIHVPLSFVRPLVDLASNWRLPAPINSEQLAMLLEENIVHGESNALRESFGFEPGSLRSVLQRISGESDVE
ncbi:MAG: complex I NDUFA9 subunit family protein [Gemmatimonadota bacterium]|nr:MAG: complex I NDUFA9 subunit family protein [Gemmatimonadota bacterium]